MTGRLEDGQELNQVALAEQFGVSRVPIREALRQLQAEGLITAAPHRRAVVAGLTLDGLLEIFEARVLLEAYLLDMVLDRGHADVDALRRICDAAEGDLSHDEWLARNREFHQMLYRGSGSRIALVLVDQLAARIQRYLHLWSSGTGVRRERQANAEHRSILDAVERRDGDRARLELELHISHTRDQVVELFGARGPDAAGATP